MRAFMSERRHYDLCQCPINTGYYGLACECPQRALAEARCILVETEGDEPASQHLSLAELCTGPEPYWLVPGGGSVTAREILRDGLRAWLDE